MKSIPFDPLEFSNKLKDAGEDAKVAETHAYETAKILDDLINNQLTTKNDLQHELRDLEYRIYGMMIKFALFIIGSLGGIQTLFHFTTGNGN